MTVMRDDMNWPMADIIKKVSDQKLRGMGMSGNKNISFNATHRLSLIGCERRMPSIARMSSGIAAKKRNTILTNYHRSLHRPISGK